MKIKKSVLYALFFVNTVISFLVYTYMSSNKIWKTQSFEVLHRKIAKPMDVLVGFNKYIVDVRDNIETDTVKVSCLDSAENKSWYTRRNNEHCVRIIDAVKVSQFVSSDACIILRLWNKSTPICIHDPRRDRVVSASIFRYGSWEIRLVTDFIKALRKDSNMDLLDIGCNIGMYTLAAARQGIRVVAVDANFENMVLLSKAVVLGNFTKYVTLIWNAVSNRYEKMYLQDRKFNIGAQKVQTLSESKNQKPDTDTSITKSIRLDDLIGLFKDRPVAIKIDVEEHEFEVLEGGYEFLKNVDVRFIQMEIVFHQFKESGSKIVDIMKKFGFVPFLNCLGQGLLAFKSIIEWPRDVCFIKLTQV